MNYIIVNNSNYQEFEQCKKQWLTQGLFFTTNYIEEVPETIGGWGCFRFDSPLPQRTLFDLPDVEYRYSEEQNAWLADGQLTPYSNIVVGLHSYFVSLEEPQ